MMRLLSILILTGLVLGVPQAAHPGVGASRASRYLLGRHNLRDVMGISISQMHVDTIELNLIKRNLSVITEEEVQLLVQNYPNLEVLLLSGNKLRKK